MANMKNMKNALSTNQITPGTQVNGADRDRRQPAAQEQDGAHGAHGADGHVFAEHEHHVGVEDPYSTMKPATSSDSASTRSNGGRLVSASAETKKMTNIGNSGSQYQPNRPQLAVLRLDDVGQIERAAHNSTVMMTKPIETS